ncbi:hypothetical protein [Clostridium sp. AN503]|uniref:hypothetical protein n=1 Tax=Clostridium sp. AN503 TaxID=3160598 RepID=UPI00345883D9
MENTNGTQLAVATGYIEEYLREKSVASVPEMKNYVDSRMGKEINLNTFYNIVHKMKTNGFIEGTSKRGEYCWPNKQENKDTMEDTSASNIVDNQFEQSSMVNEDKMKYKGSETVSAEEFIKRALMGLRIATKYNSFLKNDISIEPWSITPEYAQCIESIKKIVEEFQKIDNILKKNN